MIFDYNALHIEIYTGIYSTINNNYICISVSASSTSNGTTEFWRNIVVTTINVDCVIELWVTKKKKIERTKRGEKRVSVCV